MNNSERTVSVPFLKAENIRKKFKLGKSVIPVLRGVSFEAGAGEWVALLGASGSGKTTLLDVIGTISVPDEGKVIINGIDTGALSGTALTNFRRRNIGFVFQSYHILPELNILENVMLPARLDSMGLRACRERALQLLEQVGLADRLNHRPNELSGGEQQRAAIARALMNRPSLLLADEPTGNLDSVTGNGILDLFREIRAKSGTTILMVTHDRNIAGAADKTVELQDGVVRSI